MAILGQTGLKLTGGNDYGLSGDVLGFENARKSKELGQEATDQFGNIALPDIEAMKLKLDDLVSQGQITPEQAQTYLQGQSAMNGISLDPRLQQAQQDALASLQDIGKNKGMTDMDRAQLAQIQSGEDTAARGQREAILQAAQSRGLGGSGIELMSQMQNQQDAATRKSARDTDVAGMAQQRALAALQAAGQMGGGMQQADFARQAQTAQANDAINQFNTANKQQVNLANTAANNTAQAANLANAQHIADVNTDTANKQQQYNSSLAQQQFENQAKLAQGKASALQAQAAGETAAGTGVQKLFGSGIGAAASVMSDERVKKDIKHFDASEFLDSLTPSKYRYKDPGKNGAGVHASPMAQDLEKTEVGKAMVKETPDGKMVDYGKGFGAILAALTDVHDRLKKVEAK